MFSDSIGIRAGAPPTVNATVLRLLKACVADLEPRRGDLALVLHQRLSELLPAQVGALPGGGVPMCQRLTDGLLQAASADPGSPHGAAVVQRLGAENEAEGFPAEQYATITHAVLHTLRDTYGGEWSSALSSGWVEFLLWFRTLLMAGAEAQRAAVLEAARAASEAASEPDRPAARPVAMPPRADEPLRVDRVSSTGSFAVAAPVPADRAEPDAGSEPGYGRLLVSMTSLGSRRERRQR